MLIIPIVYFLICGVTGLILWFRMLGVLESKGQRVNYLWVTPHQFIAFSKVIKLETDSTLKTRYRVLLWTQIILIPTFIVGMLLLIGLTV
jgi:hypothetical protein